MTSRPDDAERALAADMAGATDEVRRDAEAGERDAADLLRREATLASVLVEAAAAGRAVTAVVAGRGLTGRVRGVGEDVAVLALPDATALVRLGAIVALVEAPVDGAWSGGAAIEGRSLRGALRQCELEQRTVEVVAAGHRVDGRLRTVAVDHVVVVAHGREQAVALGHVDLVVVR